MYMDVLFFFRLLSEKLVVPLSALSVNVLFCCIYVSLLLFRWMVKLLFIIGFLVLTLSRSDDDIIGLSPGMGRYSWYQIYQVRTLWRGVGHVVHSTNNTSIYAIYVIRKFIEYVAD